MASLQELIQRFKEAGTTDETVVLTENELKDPRTKQLADLAKQNVTAEQRSLERATQKQQEEKAKKEKMATAFGLSEEEKAQYMAPKSGVSSLTMPPATPIATATSMKPIEKQETDIAPAPASRGDVQPAVAPSKDITSKDVSQAPVVPPAKDKVSNDIRDTLSEIGELQAALGANEKVSTKDYDAVLAKLNALQLPQAAAPVDTQRFVQARADAYRAYQEKADRNDWLEIAQNLVNSLTQYASARAAMGTRFEGGNLPLRGVDYGARTARAGREYEMETGAIGTEEREALAKQEREDRLSREKFAAERGLYGEQLLAEREKLREKQANIKEKGREAISLYNIISTNRRSDDKTQAYLEGKTKEIEAKAQSATSGEIIKQIKDLETQQKQLSAQLQAANNLAGSNNKTYDKSLAAFATAMGRDEADVRKEADEKSGMFTLDKTYIKETIAKQEADRIAAQLNSAREQLTRLRAVRFGEGGTPVPPPGQAIVPSTQPVSSGMITMQLPNGQTGQIPASQRDAFLQKYPGAKQVQ